MKPIYGHTSPETAYLVADYPYGRKVRCRIRYWIESDPKKGYRFVSQTEHPTRLTWNAPKRSTFALVAACLYLDDVGHVQCARLTEHLDAKDLLTFVRYFPGADLSRVRYFAAKKVTFLQGCLDGKVHFTINGEVRPWSEPDQEGHRADLALLREALDVSRPVQVAS